VLPIVLVILFIAVGVVLTQMRHSTVDERVAANTREAALLDSAANTVLRWCEAAVIASQYTAPTDANYVLPRMMIAPVAPAAAAWTDENNWTSNGFSITNAPLPGITNHACLIENATDELRGPVSSSGLTDGADGAARNPRWRKFRVTARVTLPAPDLGGARRHEVQSEIRLFL
jgi:Tfp pilus assembly protein PilX